MIEYIRAGSDYLGLNNIDKIFCVCGCNESFEKHDAYGRERQFIRGHNSKINNPAWRGGKFVDGYGYIMIKKRDHPFCNPRGYVREHRLIMEKHLGRYLDPKEVVHHINGNKQDNRIENLELFANHSKHRTNHKQNISELGRGHRF